MEREDRIQPLGQDGFGDDRNSLPVTGEPVEEGNMLFHFIRDLYRDCSGVAIVELSLIAPQLTILAYFAFDL